MTELSIRPEEIRDALQKFVSDYTPTQGEAEEVGRRDGEREAAPPGGTAGEGTGPEQGRVGSYGKSLRALGNDLRGRGLKAAAGQVVNDAFTGVEGEVGITAACRLTGRSRAAPSGTREK